MFTYVLFKITQRIIYIYVKYNSSYCGINPAQDIQLYLLNLPINTSKPSNQSRWFTFFTSIISSNAKSQQKDFELLIFVNNNVTIGARIAITKIIIPDIYNKLKESSSNKLVNINKLFIHKISRF